MNNNTFTPGPWSLISDEVWSTTPTRFNSMTVGTPRLAIVDRHNDAEGGFPWEANAKLISAAPDLLAAMEASNGLIEKAQDILTSYLIPDGRSKDEAINALLGLLDGPEQRETQDLARAAISKARGEA